MAVAGVAVALLVRTLGPPGDIELLVDNVHVLEEGRADELDPGAVFFSKEDYSPEVLGRALVHEWMTPDVVTVPPEAPLPEICAAMADRHIHRVFVAEAGRLLGVISSFDVVRLVARSAASRSRR